MITITFGYWILPVLVTIVCVGYPLIREAKFPYVDALFELIIGLCISLISWVIYASLK